MQNPLTVFVISIAENADQDDSRILYGDLAVSLVTGEQVHKIESGDVVYDLYANGAPIALQKQEDTPAQFWFFHNRDHHGSFEENVMNNLRLFQGSAVYKIVNSETGTVLGVEAVGKPGTCILNIVLIHLQLLTNFRLSLVHGLLSKGEDSNKVGLRYFSPGTSRSYIRSGPSLTSNRIITPSGAPALGFRSSPPMLPGQRMSQSLSLRIQLCSAKMLNSLRSGSRSGTSLVPNFTSAESLDNLCDIDTDSYNARIFLMRSSLAVNLSIVDEKPDFLDGAVVSLQAAKAQTWYFVRVG